MKLREQKGINSEFLFSIQMCSDGGAVFKGTCCFALECSTLWLFKRICIKYSMYISFNSLSVSINISEKAVEYRCLFALFSYINILRLISMCCFALKRSTLWLFKRICIKYCLYISPNSLYVFLNGLLNVGAFLTLFP